MVYHSYLVFILIVITHNLNAPTAASPKRISDATPIHFPKSSNTRIKGTGTNDIPEECKGQTYCTIRPPDYPEEHFNIMFEGMKIVPTPSLVKEMALTSRHGDPEEQDDCDSRVEFKPIYQVRAKRDSEWMTVVQAPKMGYIQRVRMEICEQPSAPCFNSFALVPDMQVFCTQKFSRWELLVANDTETILMSVDLPTCCSCVYKIVELT